MKNLTPQILQRTRTAFVLAAPLLWLAGAPVAPAAVKVAGQMLIDLNYTRGITTAVVGAETQVTSWTNFGVAGGSFVQPASSPYSATMANSPPFLTLGKGGVGIDVPEAGGGRALVATFATPSELQGASPYTIEVWLWKNNTAADQRGVFAWTENNPPSGDAGKLCAGDPAALHNNAKDLNWNPTAGTGLPGAGAWHHVAVTYDGTTEKVYLDGTLGNSGAKTLNINAGTYYPMIFSGIVSAAPTNTSFSLNGAIGAVRVHTDALSAADVATNSAEGMAAVPVVDVSIKSLAPTSLTDTTATLNGNLVSTTDSGSTALTFYYGTTDLGNTTSGWAASSTLAAPNSVGAFSTPISGLTADTTYYVRIHGSNVNGEGWSSPISFHTPGPPHIANLPAGLGTPGNATVSATLNPNGYATNVKLYWGTSDGGNVPASWDTEVDLGAQVAGTVSSNLTGLNPAGVTYYYTFFASNSAGSVFATPTRSFKTRNIPSTADLLCSALTDVLPESGVAGTWASFLPSGQTFAPINAPTVKKFGGVKWVKNLSVSQQGFRLQDPAIAGGNYTSSIPVNGVSIVVAMKPLPRIPSDNWDSIVDIFYDRLVLGMRNDTGQVNVRRNGSLEFSTPTIPVGQTTILSLVVQPTGEYKVWANGVEIMNIATTSAMTSLVPNVPGPFANAINLGRNNPDGWPVFNGEIGDVFVYKTALSDPDRLALEADLTTKFVTDATLTYTVTASAGANGTISPTGPTSVLQGNDQSYTITGNSGFVVSDVLVDGVSVGPALTYTFADVSANHTIAASFVSLPPQTITATAGSNGSISPSGATLVNAGSDQTFTIAADSGYKIADVLVDGVSVGAPSAYTFTFVIAAHTINVSFAALSLNIPRSSDLLFSAVTDDLPGDGLSTGNWPTYVPAGNLTAMATPMVEVIGSNKWEQNNYTDGDGFRVGAYTTAIPINGLTAVAAFRPVRNATPTGRSEIIDVMYSRFFISVENTTGELMVVRNGAFINTGYVVPDGEKTIVSVVVQPDGTFKVYVDGILVKDELSTSPMTALDPTWNGGGLGFWSNINVGRNEPDGWTVFNGNIGDVFLYKTALTDGERMQLEGILLPRYGIVLHTITASAGAGGTISPSGTVQALEGADKTFTITPNLGFTVQDVLVDGASVGPVTSYTFPAVSTTHTIVASFNDGAATHTITATAGTGGSITPSGAVSVPNATDQGFTIAADPGYVLADVLVDGSSIGAVTSHTITNVTADHTITAVFITIFADWAKSKGLDGTPGKEAGAAADPDKDGRTNLQEFAFNGDPLSATDKGHVYTATELVPGDPVKKLVLTIAVRDTATAFAGTPSPSLTVDGITYTIEGSLNLSSFLTQVDVVSPALTSGLPSPGTGYQYRSFSLQGNIGSVAKGFLRAKVTEP